MDAWWRRLRSRCFPLTNNEPLSSDELVAALSRIFAPIVAPRSIAERLELPASFCRYLDVLGPHTWISQRVALDFLMQPATVILSRVTEDLESYLEDDPVTVAGAGLWIQFASHLDRHTWFLCCDRDRPGCGEVFDAHDDHPWLNGASSLYPCGSFDAWLAEVSTWRSRAPTLMIAPTLEELADLDRLRKADPWELLVAMRDLEYRVTPDEAWQHAIGAPERIVLLSDWQPPEELISRHTIYRDPECVCSLIPVDELADEEPPVHTVGGWDAQRKFSWVEDAGGRLHGLSDVARTFGQKLLFCADVDDGELAALADEANRELAARDFWDVD